MCLWKTATVGGKDDALHPVVSRAAHSHELHPPLSLGSQSAAIKKQCLPKAYRQVHVFSDVLQSDIQYSTVFKKRHAFLKKELYYQG